jgi:exopolysaccharide biosynthesis polyprenyl glycosylphosphotransferase
MRKQSHLIFGVALLVGDFLAVLSAFVIAYILRVKVDPRPLVHAIPARTYLLLFLSLIPFWLVIFSSLGLYRKEMWSHWLKEAWLLLVGSFAGTLFIIGYDFVSDQPVFPARLVAAYALLLGFGLLLAERWLMRLLRRLALYFGIGTVRVMLIGDSMTTRELAEQLLAKPHSGYHISAIVASRRHVPQEYEGRVYGSFDQALRALDRLDIESVIQTQLSPNPEDNQRLVAATAQRHLEYRLVPEQSSVLTAHSELELFAGFPMLTLHQTRLVGWGQVVKRFFDLGASLLLLVLLLPFLLIIAAAIKIMDPGPVFFRQKRLTRYGRQTSVYKFRSMKREYSGRDPAKVFEEMGRPELAREYAQNRAKVSDDPRISRIGRFLRNYSLDELPQLFNVIGGSLSLVGPRAIPKEELEYFKDHGPLVLKVKTGITGLAQVTGRSDITLDERLQLDLYYVQNWSLWLDLKILFRTVLVVLSRSGAA